MRKPTLPLYIVEAFTTGDNEVFTGNTAAICVLESDNDLDDEIKQKMGMNMNLSETAFVTRGWTKETQFKDPLRWTLRWFTPLVEYPLCGHATLATSNIIFNEILKEKYSSEKETTIVFESKFRGELGATMDWSTGLIRLDFPANPTVPITVQEHPWLTTMIEKTLGAHVGHEVFQDIHFSKDMNVMMLRLQDTQQGLAANEALIRKVSPDFQGQVEIKGQDTLDYHAIIVTIKGSKNEGGPNFFSRMFAPWVGTNEDPVCGSAHTMLAPFWMKEYENEGVNLKTLIGVQTSKRGGKLICNIVGDRVHIAGSTRLVLKGDFIV